MFYGLNNLLTEKDLGQLMIVVLQLCYNLPCRSIVDKD